MIIGMLGKSFKENEKRYPIHQKHLASLSDFERSHLIFEEDYPGIYSTQGVFSIFPRHEVFQRADIIVLPKPDRKDYDSFHDNQILWGWPHAVQGREITQLSIDKRLTVIAWENMFKWVNGVKREHVFARNNELAGYAAVNHFMELNGVTPGVYGENMKIAVLGYGSTARGAINALLGLGGTDVTVYSRRSRFQIADAIKNVKYEMYESHDNEVWIRGEVAHKELANFDLIVNCVLQDPLNPLMFIRESDILSKRLLIIDISCDKGMAFDFAIPTSFDNPMRITKKYVYYAVDHTPTFFWNSASYEISGALMPYLKYIIENGSYRGNETLERAVDIENGKILNTAILKFQRRNDYYPYTYINPDDE